MSRRTAMIVKAPGNHPNGFGGRLNPEVVFLTEGIRRFWKIPMGRGFDVECFWSCRDSDTTLLDGITMILRAEIEHRMRNEGLTDIANLFTRPAPPMISNLSEETYQEIGELRDRTLADWNGDLAVCFLTETNVLNQLHQLNAIPVDIQIFLPTDRKSVGKLVEAQRGNVTNMGGQ